MNAEVLNRYPHKFSDGREARFTCLVNDNGEVVWTEFHPIFPETGSYFQHIFHWSEDSGTVEIDIDDEMHKLGFRRMEQGRTKAAGYSVNFLKLDNYGNVFLNISIDLRETMPSGPFPSIRKIGIWHKNNGFKMLNIPNIDTVAEIKFSPDRIFVIGQNMARDETFEVLRPIDGHWPWEPEPKLIEETVKKLPETTPWDTLPYGQHSARLHILQELWKNTKSSSEKKIILVMIEGEVANVFDLLEYDIKRAQTLLTQANSEGKEDRGAKMLLADSKKYIAALLSYFKKLPKESKSRIDAIHLPSKDWSPKK